MQTTSGSYKMENLPFENLIETIEKVIAKECRSIREDFELLKDQVATMKIDKDQQKGDKLDIKKYDSRLSHVPYHDRVEESREITDTELDGHQDIARKYQSGSINLQNVDKVEKDNLFGGFVYRFVESSTLHGFPRLVDSTIWVRVLWIFAMAGAVAALSIQLVGLTKDYLSFTVTTEVGIKQGNMTFPAVTVCSRRRFLASRLSSLPIVTNITGNYYSPNLWTLADILTKRYDDLSPEDISQLGGDMDETIAVFTYPGLVPSKVEVLPYHGSCYSIQSPPGTTVMMVAFNLHVDDAVDITENMNLEPGIKISLKDNPLAYHTYQPFLGIEMIKGYQSFDLVTYDEINRLNGSYGQCQNDEDAFYIRTGIAYGQQTCEKECEFRLIASRCRCLYKTSWYYPFWLKEKLNNNLFPSCDIDDATQAECMEKIYRSGENCGCKPSCHNKIFKEVNKRTLELGDCMADPTLLICRLVRPWAPNHITKEWLQKNVVAARIMLSEKPYKMYTQQPTYPFLHFLSDIGGTMGFYLGASLLTYFELVQFSVSSGLYLFNSFKQRCW